MNRTSATLHFVEMLLALLKGNSSLIDALGVLSRDGIEESTREAASQLVVLMKRGQSFSECLNMLKAKKIYFTPLYITLIRAAEMTGNIETVLDKILFDLKRKQQNREMILNILVYPILIIGVALIGTILLVYKGMPLFIQAGMLSGAFLETAILGIISAGVFLFVAGSLLLFVYFRIFGKDSSEYQIFYLLSLLLESHIPLSDALTRCIASMGETKYGKALVTIKNDIVSGVRFSQAFSRSSLFSSYISGWLSVADANGNIYEACRNIAAYFQQRDERTRNIAAKCIEPAVIIITGIYLLILVQTVILPILTHAGGVL
jgi:type II secretory pathway component PulF